MRPSSFQLSGYAAIYVVVYWVHFRRVLAWPSVQVSLLLRSQLMIDLLKIFAAVAGVFHLLQLFSVNRAEVANWVRALESAQA